MLVATTAIPTFAKASADRPEVAEDAKPMSKKTIAVKAAKIAGYTAEAVAPIVFHIHFVFVGHGYRAGNSLRERFGDYKNDHADEDYRLHSWSRDGLTLAVVGHGIYGLQKELKPYFKRLINKIKNRKNSKVETA